MFEFDLTKMKEFLLRNRLFLLPVLVMVTISIFVSECKDQKFDECEALEFKTNPIKKLLSDEDKMKFISNHKFRGNKIDFSEFIDELAEETYSDIPSIELLDESKIDKVKVKQFKITGLFWHDVFIFDFLEKLQDFSPGFLNILSIDINKFSNKISQKPTMKLEVIYKVYQK